MARTPLYEKSASLGARFAEYRGAETAAAYSGVAAELRALQAEAGVFDLGWRHKLILTGEDRVRWLNGMVTGNVRDLAPGSGLYAFLLNAQGRILGDMLVYNRGDYMVVDTDTFQATPLTETLDKFIIMDDVEVTDAGEKLTALGLRGPRAGAVLRAAGLDLPALEPLQVHDTVLGPAGISPVRGELADSWEVWLAPAQAATAWDALVAAGARPVGSDALEVQRVLDGMPAYGQDIRPRDLPQETEQYRALSFTKGCYVGQEIVERIRSRGQVHRTFTGFRLQGPPPPPGTRLVAGEREVGELTSVVTLPAAAGTAPATLALGYIRREAAASGAALQAGEARATVAALPFARAA